MKITHNKEHCFLAVWALQQYGGLRVADADENDDDARGVKKKHSSRGGHLPKELVRKIVEYLIYPSSLEIELDLGSESDVEALRGTVDFLCKAFLRQPELEVWHEPSQTMFARRPSPTRLTAGTRCTVGARSIPPKMRSSSTWTSTTGREEVGRPHKYPGCLVSYRPLARSPRQSVFC